MPSPIWSLPICLDSWTYHSKFLCSIVFTSSALASITSHIYNCVLFLLFLCLFILFEVISPLMFSSILDTYWPGGFIFQCHILLPFHTVLGVLKIRMLKWFAIPSSSGPRFVRTLHHRSWVVLHGLAHSFIELDKAVVHVIRFTSFCDGGFQYVCPLMPSLSAYCITGISLTLVMGYLLMAGPVKRSCHYCPSPWSIFSWQLADPVPGTCWAVLQCLLAATSLLHKYC